MRKELKATLALGAAGALLVGGGGTLAYWSATGTLPGVAPTAGELQLLAEDCNGASGSGSGWFFDGLEDPEESEYADGDLIVPGDVLTKTCTWEIQATGEHLRAGLTATAPVEDGDLAPVVTVASTFTVGGQPITEITEANDGDTLQATVTITFPLGAASDNSSQAKALSLGDYAVVLTQAHD